MIESFLNSTPWLWPALALAVAISLVLFRPLARVLNAPRPVALLILLGLGGIAALTLTPGEDAFARPFFQDCFVRLAPPIGVGRVLNLGERGLNVLLFLPLGLGLGLLPGSRTKLALVAGALVLPFVIEGIQYLAPALDRSCSTVDVVDNLTGLLVGLVVGLVGRVVLSFTSRSGGDPAPAEAGDQA
jgi:glycopeptide antibiotics resistance protein